MYWTSTDELMISPTYIMVSPTCTEHPRCTHNILRCTEHSPMYSWYPPDVLMVSPRCTHGIPPMYSWYPPDVLNIPRCTDHTLYRVNLIFYHSKILWNLGYQEFIYCILCQRHFHARSTFRQGRLIQMKNGKDKYKEFLYVQPYWLMNTWQKNYREEMWSDCKTVIHTEHNKWNFDRLNFIEFPSRKNQVAQKNCWNSASSWVKLFGDVSNKTYRCWESYEIIRFDTKVIGQSKLSFKIGYMFWTPCRHLCK